MKKGEMDFGVVTKWILVVVFLALFIIIIVTGILVPGFENSLKDIGGIFS